jgi:3-oxoacyl-[acyl-carrier-protein] synthase-3
LRRAAIAGIGSYAPARVVRNADLEQMLDTTDEWITARTGIRERRLAGPEETTATMGAAAAARALAASGVDPADLDVIICATNTSDTVFPGTGARIGAALGAVPCPAFDVQAGCTGLLYALDVAAAGVEAGRWRHALVVGSDTLSRITDWTDRTTAVLFGDGAGALVVGASERGRGLLASHLSCDGRGADLLSLPAGGSACPASVETVQARQHYLRMNGREVFKFAVRAVPLAVEQVLRKAGVAAGDVDLWVPHQANLRIIEAGLASFALDADRVVVNVDRYANTSVASIPLALTEAWEAGRLVDDGLVLLVAFGAGLTAGAVLVRWGV